MRIDTSEVHRLAHDLDHGVTSAETRAQLATAKTAYDIQSDAQTLAPVDTGALKVSISVTIGDLKAEIGPTVEYGIWQEIGTSRQAGQPYLRPAFDRRLPAYEQALQQIGLDIL